MSAKKVKVALLQKLLRLAQGETLPYSSLRGDDVGAMLDDGVLIVTSHGSKRTLHASDAQALREYLNDVYDVRSLEATVSLLENKESRAAQVRITGDSKFVRHRTFQGFLVNTIEPVEGRLGSKWLTIAPDAGTFLFISDYNVFSIASETVVVGVENAENFSHLQAQRRFFEQNLPAGVPWLFVCRYPQQQSKDLRRWLESIPNRYVHFGDLDLAGVSIFLTEYYAILGERATMLVPIDYRERLAIGSPERYNAQFGRFAEMDISDSRLESLVEAIHAARRGYDQEGFIG